MWKGGTHANFVWDPDGVKHANGGKHANFIWDPDDVLDATDTSPWVKLARTPTCLNDLEDNSAVRTVLPHIVEIAQAVRAHARVEAVRYFATRHGLTLDELHALIL